MRLAKCLTLAAGLATTLAGAGLAEPVDAKAARKQLFRVGGYEVQPVDAAGLSAGMQAQVDALVAVVQSPDVASQFGAFGYYGAIALVPDQPISEKTMAISAKLHNPAAARVAALAGCDDNSAAGSADCVVVALIVPKKYQPRDLTLNEEASQTFRATWRKGGGPKALAYSPTTTAWVIAKGEGAAARALERCNVTAAELIAADCEIGVAEE